MALGMLILGWLLAGLEGSAWARLDSEFRVNTYTTDAQRNPAVAGDGAGKCWMPAVGAERQERERGGFSYKGPTGGDGDPVRQLSLERRPGGQVVVRAILKGTVGTQSLDVVPPNLADEGGIVLTINEGASYCVAFGGAAGGTERRDNAGVWKIRDATAEPGCPTP